MSAEVELSQKFEEPRVRGSSIGSQTFSTAQGPPPPGLLAKCIGWEPFATLS